MQEIAEKTLHAYQEKYNLLLPSGGWVFSYPADNIKVAQKWEVFLLNNYPSLHLSMQKIQKKFEEEMRKVKPAVPLLKR